MLSDIAIASEAEGRSREPESPARSAEGGRRLCDTSALEKLCRKPGEEPGLDAGDSAACPNTFPLTRVANESCHPRVCVRDNCSDAAALVGRATGAMGKRAGAQA